jgi:hypothetical protein
MIIILIGTSMQAMGCLASVFALLLWTFLSSKIEDDKNSDDSSTTASTWYRLISLSIVIIAGVIETLGAQLASVAVKKEWVPIVFAEESGINNCDASYTTTNISSNNPPTVKLSIINTTITNIDLLAAMFGPVVTGWILQVLGGGSGTYSVQHGFIAIALMNALSFIPEIILLRQVYNSCPALQRRRGVSESNNIMSAEPLTTKEEEYTTNPWSIWYHHPSGLPLLTLSLSSLYLTALSPAGVVLTAYLVTIGLSPPAIGAFRASGAISGVLGIWLFSVMRNNSREAQIAGVQDIDRLRRVSLASLLLEVVSVILAGAAFSLITTDGRLSLPIIVFLGFIVLSRAGLYSFDLGVLEIEQYVVDERYRNAVGSVEGALCSIAEMGIYVMSIFMSDPTDFGWQVLVSIIAVSFGGLCFTTFLCMYHLHRHHHHESVDDLEGECAHHHHTHTHTWQQEQDLKEYGYHIHLHRHLRSQKNTL